jgi:hypothetical protein
MGENRTKTMLSIYSGVLGRTTLCILGMLIGGLQECKNGCDNTGFSIWFYAAQVCGHLFSSTMSLT